MAAVTRSRPLPSFTFLVVVVVVGIMTPLSLPGRHRKERAKWGASQSSLSPQDEQVAMSPGHGFGPRGDPNQFMGRGTVRSAVEGPTESYCPSTSLRLVPSP